MDEAVDRELVADASVRLDETCRLAEEGAGHASVDGLQYVQDDLRPVWCCHAFLVPVVSSCQHRGGPVNVASPVVVFHALSQEVDGGRKRHVLVHDGGNDALRLIESRDLAELVHGLVDGEHACLRAAGGVA